MALASEAVLMLTTFPRRRAIVGSPLFAEDAKVHSRWEVAEARRRSGVNWPQPPAAGGGLPCRPGPPVAALARVCTPISRFTGSQLRTPLQRGYAACRGSSQTFPVKVAGRQSYHLASETRFPNGRSPTLFRTGQHTLKALDLHAGRAARPMGSPRLTT